MIKIFENFITNDIIINTKWYHGAKREKLEFDNRSENIDYNMLGFGLYLTDNKEEAISYIRSNVGYIHTIEVNGNFLDYSKKIPDNIKREILTDKDFYEKFTSQDNPSFNFNDYQFTFGDSINISWDSLSEDTEWAKKGYFIFDEINDKMLFNGLSITKCKEKIQSIISKITKSTLNDIEIENYTYYKSSEIDSSDYITADNIFNSLYNLLSYLYIRFDSTKKVSEYLVKYGISGIISNISTSDYSNGSTVCVIYDKNNFKIINTIKTTNNAEER